MSDQVSELLDRKRRTAQAKAAAMEPVLDVIVSKVPDWNPDWTPEQKQDWLELWGRTFEMVMKHIKFCADNELY